MAQRPAPDSGTLWEIARLFLKLGLTAFGGPAAHIAMMREEVVQRRGWMDDGRFVDLLGATNLIPGPNSTEMAIHIGRKRGGGRGSCWPVAYSSSRPHCWSSALHGRMGVTALRHRQAR